MKKLILALPLMLGINALASTGTIKKQILKIVQ